MPRPPQLSRDQVLAAALEVADERGLAGLTIRSVATRLGTSPMAGYHYVATKDEILDALVDLVFSEIDAPSPEGAWRAEIGRRMDSAREALRRHPWAISLMESRTSPGHESLSRHEATLATLRQGGFTVAAAAHAYALIDSYVYGFALQEVSLPFEGPDSVGDIADPIMELMATGAYPTMVEMARTYYLQPGYDFADEFEFGLDLILDRLDLRRR